MSEIPLSGFKECDVRGEIGDAISETLAYRLGRAIGTVAQEKRAVVGGDFRISTPLLLGALRDGLVESGVHVYDLGQLSTPAYYFARRQLGVQVGVMVTASHSPPAWNGFKPVLGTYPITPRELDVLKRIVQLEEFTSGTGSVEPVDIRSDYSAWLAARFDSLELANVIFDCGNGATGWVIHEVLDRLNITADVLFDTPDGNFPNRSPDIAKPDDLARLQEKVMEKGAQIGIGFDGDGDRIGVVDDRGQRVSSDHLIAWLGRELLTRSPGGTVVYDLKLSRSVPETVAKSGGQSIPQKSGHTFIKTSMLDHRALFGGEYSGHLFYQELEGGDDGLFSALLVCSLLADAGQPLSDLLASIPSYYATPDIRVRYTGDRQALIEQVIARNADQHILLIDGVKVEYESGWALMRASVTEPALTFRFEGNTQAEMQNVARRFLLELGELSDTIWNDVSKT